MVLTDHAFEKFDILKVHLKVAGNALLTYCMMNIFLSLRETNY
jgi:hypothetical protein